MTALKDERIPPSVREFVSHTLDVVLTGDGFVSLRATATDRDGNTVEQTVPARTGTVGLL